MTEQENDPLLAKQENELGPKVMVKYQRKQPNCFVCKQPVEEGQEFYIIVAATAMFQRVRHNTCRRKKIGKLKKDEKHDFNFRIPASGRRVIRSGHPFS